MIRYVPYRTISHLMRTSQGPLVWCQWILHFYNKCNSQMHCILHPLQMLCLKHLTHLRDLSKVGDAQSLQCNIAYLLKNKNLLLTFGSSMLHSIGKTWKSLHKKMHNGILVKQREITHTLVLYRADTLYF